ncbi:hypothetical protein RND81_13G015900 [Saponaria officinalis]|uniref:Uncharacterized protein n=1 Tax=Saponaria officinalis TaxID=3572 RepID=A0AAW1GSY8_SAPOF
MSYNEAEAFIEMYIFRQIESQSYMTAVSLLEQFGIRHSGESFLSKMIEANDFSAAEKWASYMPGALKTLAEKGCWDVAEGKAKNDRQLLEYLQNLRSIFSRVAF